MLTSDDDDDQLLSMFRLLRKYTTSCDQKLNVRCISRHTERGMTTIRNAPRDCAVYRLRLPWTGIARFGERAVLPGQIYKCFDFIF